MDVDHEIGQSTLSARHLVERIAVMKESTTVLLGEKNPFENVIGQLLVGAERRPVVLPQADQELIHQVVDPGLSGDRIILEVI